MGLEEYQVTNTSPRCKDIPDYFTDSFSHLVAELERIDFLIQAKLKQIQTVFSSADSYRGLYITEQEIKGLFENPIGQPWWSVIDSELSSAKLKAANNAHNQIIALRVTASQKCGVRLMLDELVHLFKLSPLEKDIILLALAPQIDRRYELMFAYLQDNLTQKYLSVDLLLNLLGQSPTGRLDVRQLLKVESKLLKNSLIELADDPAQLASGFLAKIVRLPLRIVDYLVEAQNCDDIGLPFCELADINASVDELSHQPVSKRSVIALLQQIDESPANNLVYLEGKAGSGRFNAAQCIAKVQHDKLIKVDVRLFCHLSNDEFSKAFKLIVREAILQNAGLFFIDFDYLVSDELYEKYSLFCKEAQGFSSLMFLSGTLPWFAKSRFTDKRFYQVKIHDLSSLQRMSLWQNLLASNSNGYSKEELLHIADRFSFTRGQITDAIATAKQISLAESLGSEKKKNIEILYQACRLNTNKKLGELAKRITPKYNWDDIILAEDNLAQLRQLHNTVQHSAKVYDQWGFAEKLSLGKGINALFTGPPGTGKTMAAEIIAKSLGLELYKIDLSLVVSKYIGETEKNLSRIFLEAETSSAILFFDEADALFGKRTDIKNSHDRYANIEVAYLLQKMEEYDGITILATNLRKNMDEAFIRRLAFIIRFPFPEKLERKNIWRSIWPKRTPLSSDIDYEFLSEQFKLAGGNIKNIALAASFLAAEEQVNVSMKHLIKSTKREFEKQGRACVRADFGKYGNLM